MKKIERELVRRLQPVFLELGFKLMAKRGCFVRPTSYGFDEFLWTSVPTVVDGSRLKLGIVVGLRHDVVDDLVNRLDLIYGDDNRRYTTTLTSPFCLFPPSNKRTYEKSIREDAQEPELVRVADEILEIMSVDAQTFYAKYKSLEACEAGLNTPVEVISHPLFNNFEKRMYYGVACAWIVDRPDFNELVTRYRTYGPIALKAAWSKSEQRLDKLIGILKTEEIRR